jgi:hypothetical protein
MSEHYQTETLKDIEIIESMIHVTVAKLQELIWSSKENLASVSKTRNRCYKVDEIKRQLIILDQGIDKFFDMGLNKD